MFPFTKLSKIKSVQPYTTQKKDVSLQRVYGLSSNEHQRQEQQMMATDWNYDTDNGQRKSHESDGRVAAMMREKYGTALQQKHREGSLV